MHSISVVILTFNSEKYLFDVIESVTWADEILIIDSGSSDKTLEIIQHFANNTGSVNIKVLFRKFDGYISQKQFALEQVKSDWVLSIDSDEIVSLELSTEIRNILIQDIKEINGYHIPRKNYYWGKPVYNIGWYPDYKLRLVNPLVASWKGTDPHDKLFVEGKTSYLSGFISHYSYSNTSEHVNKIHSYAKIFAQNAIKADKKASVLDLTIRPLNYFFRRYIFSLGFLDGTRGFVLCILGSYYVFLKYLLLFEAKKDRKE